MSKLPVQRKPEVIAVIDAIDALLKEIKVHEEKGMQDEQLLQKLERLLDEYYILTHKSSKE